MGNIHKRRDPQDSRSALAKGALGLGVMILLAACGGRPDTTTTGTADTATSSSGSVYTVTNSSSSSSSSSGGSVGTAPLLSFNYTLDGTGGSTVTYTTPSIVADSTLIVRVVGNGGGAITVPNSNFSMNYYCVGFTVTVRGQSQTTGPIGVNGGNPTLCPNDHVDLNFAGVLNEGDGATTVEVSNPMYDYYCQLWYDGMIQGTYSMYCPLHTVYQTHTVGGQLSIQTDSTVALPAMQ